MVSLIWGEPLFWTWNKSETKPPPIFFYYLSFRMQSPNPLWLSNSKAVSYRWTESALWLRSWAGKLTCPGTLWCSWQMMRSSHNATARLIFTSCPCVLPLTPFVHVWLFALAPSVAVLRHSGGVCTLFRLGLRTNFWKQVQHHLFVVSREGSACDKDICPCLSRRLQQSGWWPTFSVYLFIVHVSGVWRGGCFENGIDRLERDDSGMWWSVDGSPAWVALKLPATPHWLKDSSWKLSLR